MDADEAVAQATAAPPAPRRSQPPAGLEAFYRENFKILVWHVLLAGAQVEADAEDAAALALEQLMKAWERVENPLAWARKAAINNFLQKKQRDRDRASLQRIDFRKTWTPRGDEEMEAHGERKWVEQMLRELTTEQREVMEWVFEGYSPSEAAAKIGISQEAARQRLATGRKRLIKLLHTDQVPRSGAGLKGKETR